MPAQRTDLATGAALAVFPLLYGGLPIAYMIATLPEPRLDPFGDPRPDMTGDAIAYVLMATMLAFLSHLIVFIPLRYRVVTTWRLRALVPLQVLVVALSCSLWLIDSIQLKLLGVLLGPAAMTAAVYLLAARIVRVNSESLLTRSS